MIQWSRQGREHIGTTDCGLRFVVQRWHDARCYSMSVQTSEGREFERTVGYDSIRAAKTAAAITAAGMREVQS